MDDFLRQRCKGWSPGSKPEVSATGLDNDEGAGLAEYALLLLLIAIVCVGALTALGTTIAGAFNTAQGMFN